MFFRTVRDQFLVEIAAGPDGAGSAVDTLAELNSLFTAWVEQVYHQRVHTETGMTPLARFLAAGPPVPTPAGLLTEAFRWGNGAPSPRPRRSACTATSTRSTRRWPGPGWSWCSTRSTSPTSTCATTAGRPAVVAHVDVGEVERVEHQLHCAHESPRLTSEILLPQAQTSSSRHKISVETHAAV